MSTTHGRNTPTPTDHRDDDRNFTRDDDRYNRADRPMSRADEEGFRTRSDPSGEWRRGGAEQYGQGQSGYTAGRYEGDRSLGFQARNQGYAGAFEDHTRSGDERFSGRGGSAYWREDRGYSPDRERMTSRGNPGEVYRRHNVGNYGYGSDTSNNSSGRMADQSQGVGMQGWFGGNYGGYGHVGSYGPDGGMHQHGGAQGWEDTGSGNGQRQFGGEWGRQAELYRRDQRPGGHRGKGPVGYQKSDERIKEAVSDALLDHDHIDATRIEVLVKDREVTLSGNVEDRDAKRLAEDIAVAVSGVKDVHNQLRIGGHDREDDHRTPEPPEHKKARA